MRITPELIEKMVVHAQADAPDECCGIVAMRDGVATEVYRARNIHESALRFEIDPQDQIRIWGEIDKAGHEIGALYHSHTRSPPYPSQTDINMARPWPGTVWIIVGLAGEAPEVKAYDIVDGRVQEAELAAP
ncbi:MAG TPA: M67 family metallopeptidase [Solirubrobacteraceae bacterium]|nr:M67 family metallopeptidase [Solirubrobacteraceae bacterium]